MRLPTKTHFYPLLGLFLALLLIVTVVILLQEKPKVEVPGCRQVKHPSVCLASYKRCNNIGLDEACLAVAQLDGQLGYDAVNGRQIPMSQNIKTGDNPVERVHN